MDQLQWQALSRGLNEACERSATNERCEGRSGFQAHRVIAELRKAMITRAVVVCRLLGGPGLWLKRLGVAAGLVR